MKFHVLPAPPVIVEHKFQVYGPNAALVASCRIESEAWQIATMLNDQSTIERLRAQLFEAREQRDTAREEATFARNQWNAEHVELGQVRDALKASHRELANARNYWPTQSGDHVVMSLANYTSVVKARDVAIAERDALEKELTQVCSYVNGRWVKTS